MNPRMGIVAAFVAVRARQDGLWTTKNDPM
jgi:hypothetical protein